ncbi:MAG: glycosyltransferase family 2 protein [Acidobacteriota bacterium]
MRSDPELSVVLPVFNEDATLPELHRRLLAVLEGLGLPFEVIYVDDGSSDGSAELLRERAAADGRVILLVLSRNFGHQIALTAGLDHARGDAVVLMDSDLQDPPELIPTLVSRWKEGLEVVYAQRRARPGESLFKRVTAYLFYRWLRAVAIVDIPADTGDFRLLSRRAADALRSLPERGRFMRGLVAWVGFRQGKVLYDRPSRKAGESKYRLAHMFRLAMAGAFAFSGGFPISLLGAAGGLVTAGSLLAMALGAPTWTAGLFFLGGVQLLGLWVLGQYLSTVAEEVRGRPLYVIRDEMNVHPAAK